MTEQQRPDEDVEGHARAREDAADEVEGHGRAYLGDGAADEDVEGHGWTHKQDPGAGEDDVEGHSRLL